MSIHVTDMCLQINPLAFLDSSETLKAKPKGKQTNKIASQVARNPLAQLALRLLTGDSKYKLLTQIPESKGLHWGGLHGAEQLAGTVMLH